MLLDEPAKAKACLDGDPAAVVVRRCRPFGRMARTGQGRRSAGLRAVSTSPSVRPSVWSTRARSRSAKGWNGCRAISTVIGGSGVLCAAELIAFADQHAPVKQFNELVAAAKNDPAFLAQQAAVKAAYRADHIEKASGARQASGRGRDASSTG